jgi:hypothetical protein
VTVVLVYRHEEWGPRVVGPFDSLQVAQDWIGTQPLRRELRLPNGHAAGAGSVACRIQYTPAEIESPDGLRWP